MTGSRGKGSDSSERVGGNREGPTAPSSFVSTHPGSEVLHRHPGDPFLHNSRETQCPVGPTTLTLRQLFVFRVEWGLCCECGQGTCVNGSCERPGAKHDPRPLSVCPWSRVRVPRGPNDEPLSEGGWVQVSGPGLSSDPPVKRRWSGMRGEMEVCPVRASLEERRRVPPRQRRGGREVSLLLDDV